MTQFELAIAYRNHLLSQASRLFLYPYSHGLDTFVSRLKDSAGYTDLRLDKFTAEQLKQLGASDWEEGHTLFPAWLHPFIDDNTVCTSIDGEVALFKDCKEDNDQRFGCLAYGVKYDAQQDS